MTNLSRLKPEGATPGRDIIGPTLGAVAWAEFAAQGALATSRRVAAALAAKRGAR